MLNNTKLRHFWAQIVSWAPRHARKTFIVLAPRLYKIAAKTSGRLNLPRPRLWRVNGEMHVGLYVTIHLWRNVLASPFTSTSNKTRPVRCAFPVQLYIGQWYRRWSANFCLHLITVFTHVGCQRTYVKLRQRRHSSYQISTNASSVRLEGSGNVWR